MVLYNTFKKMQYHFQNICTKISHNVPCIRRFASPNEQNRKVLQGWQTVGGGWRGSLQAT